MTHARAKKRKTAKKFSRHMTVESVRVAVMKCRGNLAAVGRAFGISRQAVHDYINHSDELLEAVDEARESTTDKIINVLIDAAEDGEPWAVKHYLNTQAKHRGFAERAEGSLAIDVTIHHARQQAAPLIKGATLMELEVLREMAVRISQRARDGEHVDQAVLPAPEGS